MKKMDGIIIGVILVIAIGLFAFGVLRPQDPGGEVIATVDGEEYGRYPLDEDGTFTIATDYGENIFVIAEGKVHMEQASCPDKLCQKQGEISLAHETIVCLPNRVVLEITQGEENQWDSVAS